MALKLNRVAQDRLIKSLRREAEHLENSAKRIESFLPYLASAVEKNQWRLLAEHSRKLAEGYRKQVSLVEGLKEDDLN